MKKNLLLIIACMTFYSCDNVDSTKVEREGEPTIYKLNDEDKQMNVAIVEAIKSLDTFKFAIISNNKNFINFALKKRFKTADGGEHIWLSDITVKNEEYSGIVNNEPEYTNEVKLGDTVKIERENISDWMYIANGKVKGGYTIRVLRDKMDEEEKKKFDVETGLEFE